MDDISYLIYTPRNSRSLLSQYPELSEFEEFKPHVLKPHDLLFVWYMRCETSPFDDVEDKDKLEECINKAYPTEQQRKAKSAEFKNGFPDNIKMAMKRMESFNKHLRVENYLYLRRVRETCKELLGQDPKSMDEDQKDAWAKRAPSLWKLMDETSKAIERGAFGVVEERKADINEMDGSVRAWRQSHGR
jgi:hypothetical protein